MNNIESTVQIEKQYLYENTYNRRNRNKLLRKVTEPIINKLIANNKEQLENNLITKEMYENNDKLLAIVTEIIVILFTNKTISGSSLFGILLKIDSEFHINTDMILKAIIIGSSYDCFTVTNKGGWLYLSSIYEANEKILRIINRFKYLNPMIVKPLPVNEKGDNKGSGYLTIRNDSLILGNVYHKGDIDTKVLDRLNSISFELNERVIRNYRNHWNDLDNPKKATIKNNQQETMEEYLKRLDSFHRYEKAVYKTMAELLACGNKFYFTHKYEKRGRMFCQGYQVNYQGNSYAKAVLNLSNKEVTNDYVDFFFENDVNF